MFNGLKITADAVAATRHNLERVKIKRERHALLVSQPAVIGDGGNSGFQALNLAVQFGARRIILVGYDMRIDRGVHWHGKHVGLNNPQEKNVTKWRAILDRAAPLLAALGVTVINASTVSALEAYPKMSIDEALTCSS